MTTSQPSSRPHAASGAEDRAPHSSPEEDLKTPPKGVSKKGLLQTLGPGLITGASDDDPSGIATYSQVGAQFGYHMLWVMLFSYPLMCGIQEISAQIGRVTGRGISGNLRRYYSPWLLYPVVLLVVIANVINLGADLGAMGASVTLLTGLPALPFTVIFALMSLTLQAIAPYDRYSKALKWLTITLFAYIATVFVVHIQWGAALLATVKPTLSLKTDYITALVAVLGTTISPYLFFWQASEEVEAEEAEPGEEPLKRAPCQAPSQLHRIRVDTYTGMAFSNLVAFFIILTAAGTLYRAGIHDVSTATQAASALKPVAGKLASLLFASGIVGTGLLAVPVLAGSAAYAVGEALRWPVGLSREPLQAKGFYGVIAVAMLLGAALNFTHIDPIKALFWSAVLNGVVAGPIMLLMMFLACNKRAMGQFTLNARQKTLGWIATGVMFACAVVLFSTWGH
jgi:NRAMP (natural resistance-associated macrophage protein)-like metal ion transporter